MTARRREDRTLFDTHIVVDWSARSVPSPARPVGDAIWWCAARDGTVGEPEYARTRHDAVRRLGAILARECAAGRRVLAGFDFPFGYPAGFAGRLTGRADGPAVWDWLAARIRDGEDNANNRYAVAGSINRMFPGLGPFWGRPRTWCHPDIPIRGRDRSCRDLQPPERRIADRRAAGAKTVWQLAYAGSVGSQALLGLPALKRLTARYGLRDRAAVWPLETGLRPSGKPVVLVELYPSLLRREVAELRLVGEIADRAQVRVNTLALALLDRAGRLAPLFHGVGDLASAQRRIIEAEEAWIFGLGHEDALRAALGSGHRQ